MRRCRDCVHIVDAMPHLRDGLLTFCGVISPPPARRIAPRASVSEVVVNGRRIALGAFKNCAVCAPGKQPLTATSCRSANTRTCSGFRLQSPGTILSSARCPPEPKASTVTAGTPGRGNERGDGPTRDIFSPRPSHSVVRHQVDEQTDPDESQPESQPASMFLARAREPCSIRACTNCARSSGRKSLIQTKRQLD